MSKLKKMHLHLKLRDEIIFNLVKILHENKIAIPEPVSKVLNILFKVEENENGNKESSTTEQ